jgi:hypothetical protein
MEQLHIAYDIYSIEQNIWYMRILYNVLNDLVYSGYKLH